MSALGDLIGMLEFHLNENDFHRAVELLDDVIERERDLQDAITRERIRTELGMQRVISQALQGAQSTPVSTARIDKAHDAASTLMATACNVKDCICADPENCREPIPGRRCKAGL